MIKINFIGRKKRKFEAPTILGVEISEISLKGILIVVGIRYGAGFLIQNYFDKKGAVVRNEIKSLNAKKKDLNEKVRGFANVEGNLEIYNQQIQSLKERSLQVKKIIEQKSNPKLVMEKIARIIPEDLWMSRIEILEGGNIKLVGETVNYTSLGNFMSTLNSTPFFSNTLTLPVSKTVERTYDGVKVRVEEFEIGGKITKFDPFLE